MWWDKQVLVFLFSDINKKEISREICNLNPFKVSEGNDVPAKMIKIDAEITVD